MSEASSVVDSANAFGDTHIKAFGDTHINAFGDRHIKAFGDTHVNAFGVWGGQRLTHKKTLLGLDTHISEVHGPRQARVAVRHTAVEHCR